MFEHLRILNRPWGPAARRRRPARQFRPAVSGTQRLEPRALLHAGPVSAHVAPISHPVAPTPVAPAAFAHARRVPNANNTPGLQTIQTRDATILVPTDLVPGRTYPLVVAFAYNGNPAVPFQVWRTQAVANDWIVYASKDYKNAVLNGGIVPSEKVAAKIKAQIDALPATLPVDTSRIIFTGMSGGANFSDYMNLRYPGYAAGVIINSGEIPFQLFRKTPARGFDTLPTAADFNGSRRVGVFLASPTDSQFYGITQSNAKFMQTLGWNTVFFSFPGGHWNAPPATYTRAINWILSQPSWTTNP